MATQPPLRVGLIGAGKFALELADVIDAQPALAVAGVCDVVAARAEALAQRYDAPYYASSRPLVRRSDIDAVLILTSHDMHLPNVVEAAEEGKHIFCEKPMGLTVDECRTMIDAVTRTNVKLLVGHVTRLLPVAQRIRQIVEDGVIGEAVLFNLWRTGWAHRQEWWASKSTSGGMVHSPGAHTFDYINSLLGRAERLYAVAAPRIQHNVDFDDTITVTMTYESGAIASAGFSISSPLSLYRGEIIATRGALHFSWQEPRCTLTYQRQGEQPMQETYSGFADQVRAALTSELENLVGYFQEDAPPFVTAYEAMQAVAMIQATYESIKTRRPVTLPLSAL